MSELAKRLRAKLDELAPTARSDVALAELAIPHFLAELAKDLGVRRTKHIVRRELEGLREGEPGLAVPCSRAPVCPKSAVIEQWDAVHGMYRPVCARHKVDGELLERPLRPAVGS